MAGMAVAWVVAESTSLRKIPPGDVNMRRYPLGLVVLLAAVFALPASGREFRGDSLPCDAPPPPDNPYCWTDIGQGYPALPLGLPSSSSPNFFVPSAVTSSYPYLDFFTPSSAAANFDFVAFYYEEFLKEKGILPNTFPPVNGPAISQGLLRTGSGDRPLLRVSWFLDESLAQYTDVFKPYQLFGDPTDHVGIQLIFGIEPDSFQLNGFNNDSPTAYRFSASFGCGQSQSCDFPNQEIWYGGTEPCDTFAISDGRCIGLSAVPEPSSLALLGLGFLALVFGMRTANPIRARLS